MKTKILVVIIATMFILVTACAKKNCPAYGSVENTSCSEQTV